MKIPGWLMYQGFRRGLRHPFFRPLLIGGILLYLISPIDLVPSFLPVVGQIDDLALLSLLAIELLQMGLGDPFFRKRSDDPPPTNQGVIDIAAVELEE